MAVNQEYIGTVSHMRYKWKVDNMINPKTQAKIHSRNST